MTTQTHLQITAPCNEDWNKMTNSEKGRFCDSCSSQVIDFTVLTDHQVLAYLAAANGKVCGRFNADQLNRGLQDTSIRKKKIWHWALAGFTSLFFASKGFSQGELEKHLPQTAFLSSNGIQDAIKDLNASSITIKGKIVNDAHIILSNASIVEPETLNKILNNRNGNFIMHIDAKTTSVLVQANGYDSRVVPVALLKNADTTIILSTTDTTITGVEGLDKISLDKGNVIMGGITNFTEIEKPSPVTTFVKKIFNNSFFKILPNPTANGRLGLSVKQAGMYTVQIFDNNSKLVHVAEITINDKGQVVHITLPNCVSKGNYYVRLIDTKTKKEYVDKLIVQ
ncbi:MAG: T9SS type A sorting domain-containing protein [Chitinophagaceae bacterium]|nr:T9SS type A sorting domain-containing protein [Chitinophagaceae bacterium]